MPPGTGFASVSQPAGFGAPISSHQMAPAGYNPQYVGMPPQGNPTLYQGGLVPPQQPLQQQQPMMGSGVGQQPQPMMGSGVGQQPAYNPDSSAPPSYEQSKN